MQNEQSNSGEGITGFILDIQKKQDQEKVAFEQSIEKHDKLLLKYRKEVYNESPNLERLFQLERIITQFIDLLNSNKYEPGYHNVSIESTFTDFLEWKQRLSDRVISEYKELLVSVNYRSKQTLYYQSNNLTPPKPPQLSKDEQDLTKVARGPYNTKRAEMEGYYRHMLETAIQNELRQKKKINYKKVEDVIFKTISTNKDVAPSTLRGWFPAAGRQKRFDEIHQRLSPYYKPH